MDKIRYAVVGLGHIAQAAVLPSFEHAIENSQLTALISNDSEKLSELSKRYHVENCYTYEQYERALHSGTFDAVYIALPNDMHAEYTVKAAEAGINVLCEKPMALTEEECLSMIAAADYNKIKLMVAYRLHFEKTNMEVVELIKSGKIGEPRIFNSTFTMQVREGNIRTQREHGGGPLYDMGIYCINAARYAFQSEPVEVSAIAVRSGDPRFSEVEESVAAILKFPHEKLATFICSFGASDASTYEIEGTQGRIVVDPAYDYAVGLQYTLTVDGKEKTHSTPKRDQFAPELVHFSNCIIKDREPRPSGYEGLADVRVIEAIHESVHQGKMVPVRTSKSGTSKPDAGLVQEKPAYKEPQLVRVEAPSRQSL